MIRGIIKMAEQNFNQTLESLYKGMDGFLSAKSVVGEPTRFEDGTIIIPLADVSFGLGAGAFAKNTTNSAGGGIGCKMSPNSVVVLKDGHARLINLKDQDTMNRVMDLVPEIIDKLKRKFGKDEPSDSEIKEKAKESLDN